MTSGITVVKVLQKTMRFLNVCEQAALSRAFGVHKRVSPVPKDIITFEAEQ